MIIIETCPERGHDLTSMMLASNPPIEKRQCLNCGWSWTGKREEVVRIPFDDNGFTSNTTNYLDIYGHYTTSTTLTYDDLNNDNYKTSLVGNFEQSACTNCPNNPKNGGSGICHCTLGQQTIY